MNGHAAPVRTATLLSLRELRRRWLTVAFMVLMPTAYFVVMFVTHDGAVTSRAAVFTGAVREVVTVVDRDFQAVYLSTLGISITAAFAALTTIKDRAPIMRRLRLAGYGAGQLLTARLAVLALITVVSTAVFVAILVPLVPLRQVGLVAGALLLVGLLGVGLGTVLGLVLDREFEASMIIIAICGLQMALGRSGSDVERYLLFWPPVEALKTAGFTDSANVGRFLLQGLGYAAVLFAASYAIWVWRTRVWPPDAGTAGVAAQHDTGGRR